MLIYGSTHQQDEPHAISGSKLRQGKEICAEVLLGLANAELPADIVAVKLNAAIGDVYQ